MANSPPQPPSRREGCRCPPEPAFRAKSDFRKSLMSRLLEGEWPNLSRIVAIPQGAVPLGYREGPVPAPDLGTGLGGAAVAGGRRVACTGGDPSWTPRPVVDPGGRFPSRLDTPSRGPGFAPSAGPAVGRSDRIDASSSVTPRCPIHPSRGTILRHEAHRLGPDHGGTPPRYRDDHAIAP